MSVGIDAGVSDDIKLPVLNSEDDSAVYRSMIAFVATSQSFDAWGLRAKQCLAVAVTGICQTKLVRLRGVGADVAAEVPGQLVPDGEWKSVAFPVNATDEQINALTPSVFQNPNLVQSMLLCIAATKANWWAMDHHTGQGAMVGYALKVANVHLSDLQDNIRMQLMHLVGHWCSAIYILTRAAVEGLRTTVPAWGNEPAHPIVFSDDARLRFSSFPAGTHRLAVAYEGVKKLIANRISRLYPDAGNLGNLVCFKALVDAARAQYHVGALYLCNQRSTEYTDNEMEQCLGHIGTFIRVFFSTTTLCQSPYLTQLKVRGYEDYSIDWFNGCNIFKLNQRS